MVGKTWKLAAKVYIRSKVRRQRLGVWMRDEMEYRIATKRCVEDPISQYRAFTCILNLIVLPLFHLNRKLGLPGVDLIR